MIHEVDRHGVLALVSDGAQLVDVMPSKEFHESHLPGAVSIPLAQLAERAQELATDRPVIVYCYDSL